MQVTKQLIDEFEADWKPIKRIYYCFSIEMYRPRDYLMASHVHREADTQQGRLEAWLKEREKIAADIGKIIVGARRPADAKSIIFVHDLPDWVQRAIQASQPQEKERE